MTSSHPSAPREDGADGESTEHRRWARVRQVFEHARTIPQLSRRAELDRLCAGDEQLRDEVESLLAAGDARTLETPGAPSPTAGQQEAPGTMIGQYRIDHLIGEGGFGTVYHATQAAPIVRSVALKVIRAGMDSREIIARFEVERQALAAMDHPGIARVLDAGSTPSGRPYFVMELVKGVPITQYCETDRLSLPARLALFQQVCSAVQHAHQKGIIHRDLKPSNILVTRQDDRPMVKVIDFGIAKATGFSAVSSPALTRVATLLGTPAYMAPELADLGASDVDTRADVYALGVVLYELLTGTTPFSTEELHRAGFTEMRRLIREVDPPRPSARAERLGAAVVGAKDGRSMSSARMLAELRGDLDWIVMKALDKDRSRRYTSAAELAADLGRHLSGQAVIAAPPSRLYLARKFVGRHRVTVGAAALVTAGLVLSAAIAGRGLLRAERALAVEQAARESADRARREASESAEQARQELARSAAVTEFLRELLRAPLPQRSGAEVKLVDLLRRSDAMVAERFADVPATELAVREMVVGMLLAVDAYADAEPHAARCLDLALSTTPLPPGAESRESDLAWMQRWYQPLWRVGIATGRPQLGETHTERLAQRYGQDDPRVRALREVAHASAVATKVFAQGVGTPSSEKTRVEAPSAVDRAHAEYVAMQDQFGDNDARTVEALFTLAQRQASARLRDEADASYAAALRALGTIRAGSDPALVARLIEHAMFRADGQKPSEAARTLDEAISDARRRAGESTSEVVPALIALSNAHDRAGNAEAGLAAAERARDLALAAHGPLHARSFLARQTWMLRLIQARRFDEALQAADELLRDAQAGGGSDGTLVASAHGMRGTVLSALGRHGDAVDAYAQAIAGHERTRPSLPMLTFSLRLDRADCLLELARWDDAERELHWFLGEDTRSFRPGVFDSMKQAVAARFRRLYDHPEAHRTLPNAAGARTFWESFVVKAEPPTRGP